MKIYLARKSLLFFILASLLTACDAGAGAPLPTSVSRGLPATPRPTQITLPTRIAVPLPTDTLVALAPVALVPTPVPPTPIPPLTPAQKTATARTVVSAQKTQTAQAQAALAAETKTAIALVPKAAPPTLAPARPPTAKPPSTGARCGATCRDGSHSNATGSGACSHHGGVDHWLYCDIIVPPDR